jgi:ABC-type multidrug transport system fused ATPase/permease subunit
MAFKRSGPTLDCSRQFLPSSFFRFVLQVSGWNQAGLACLSALLFLLGIVPIELNRRIINAAAEQKSLNSILVMLVLYLLCVLAEGLVKLVFNIYRNWVGERSVRWLRRAVFASARAASAGGPEAEGIQIAIIVAEAEPVGAFVGDALSQPLLQAGVLVVVTSYLVYLQPLMALLVLAIFCPQIGFVPFMQAAVNRRVGAKIDETRQMSRGIVEAGGAIDVDGRQDGHINRIFALNMGIYKIKFFMNFMMNFLTQLGFAGILGIGGYLVLTGRTEIGTISAFIAGLSKINDPWGDLVDWYRAVKVTQVKYDMLTRALAGARPAQGETPPVPD